MKKKKKKKIQNSLIISCSTQPITKTSKFSLPQFSQQPNQTRPYLKKYWRKKELEQKNKNNNKKKVNQTTNFFFLC